MAGIRQFIAQKIKHPSIRNKWIETMYMTEEDTETPGQNIKIYWHGAPADDNVIEPRHLAQAVSNQIATIATNVAQGIANNLTFSNIKGKLDTSLTESGQLTETSQLELRAIKAQHIDGGQINNTHLANGSVRSNAINPGAIDNQAHFSVELEAKLIPTVTNGVLNVSGFYPKATRE